MQLSHHVGITLPITSEFRRAADAFAAQCPIREKADQVRRNTLAVCAVNAYLQLMDVSTDVGGSDSWQPMMQLMADAADLRLPGVGALSCRAMGVDDDSCYVPPEDWRDRIGYVAVSLDEQNGEATLVGFTQSVGEQAQVPLSQFAPIEALIDRVHGLEAVGAAQGAITQLGQWIGSQIDQLTETGWQAVDQLLNPADMGFAFRSIGTIEPPVVDVSRAKLVNLGIQLDRTVRVALVMHLTQTAADEDPLDQQAFPQTHIVLQVRPVESAAYLPEGLLLSVLDDEGNGVASATARAIDNYIQLQLTGETSEQFSVQISLGEARFEERFAI